MEIKITLICEFVNTVNGKNLYMWNNADRDLEVMDNYFKHCDWEWSEIYVFISWNNEDWNLNK